MGKGAWWSSSRPSALGLEVSILSFCSTLGNVKPSPVFPTHSFAAALLNWTSLRYRQEEEKKNTSSVRTYKIFLWGLSLVWADRFGYILGISFHSTLNFIKPQIIKLEGSRVRKTNIIWFYLARNRVHNSENSQSSHFLFYLKFILTTY